MSTLAPLTPPALERLVRVCLKKEPEERWQTMHDVATQLRGIAEGGSQLGVPAPVAARRRTRELAGWALAALFGAAAIVLAARSLLRCRPTSWSVGRRRSGRAASWRSLPALRGLDCREQTPLCVL
jgi:hypothetical protein